MKPSDQSVHAESFESLADLFIQLSLILIVAAAVFGLGASSATDLTMHQLRSDSGPAAPLAEHTILIVIRLEKGEPVVSVVGSGIALSSVRASGDLVEFFSRFATQLRAADVVYLAIPERGHEPLFDLPLGSMMRLLTELNVRRVALATTTQ